MTNTSFRNLTLGIVFAGCALAIIASYWTGVGRNVRSGPTALIGARAPSFDIATLDGRLDGVGDHHGHLVIANLWATWCEPCRTELPDLQKLDRAFRSRGVIVLGIDQGESQETVRGFAREVGIRFPLLLDQEQRYGRAFAVLGLPTTVIVNRSGTVVEAFDGALDYARVSAVVKRAL